MPGKLFVCFAGTGKTYSAKLHPDKIVDFTASPFMYQVPENLTPEEYELMKGTVYTLPENPEWPDNFANGIKEILENSDLIILTAASGQRMEIFAEYGITYELVIPEISLKDEYKSRYEKRGNDDNYITYTIDNWERRITEFAEATESLGYSIHILRNGEYIEDFLAPML